MNIAGNSETSTVVSSTPFQALTNDAFAAAEVVVGSTGTASGSTALPLVKLANQLMVALVARRLFGTAGLLQITAC